MISPESILVVSKSKSKGRGIYIGRPTPLGNPYKVDQNTSRDEAVAMYRVWLHKQLETYNPASEMFLDLLEELEANKCLILVCWCAPLKCHGDVIKEMLLEACSGK